MAKNIKKIAILTSGGDSPAMNNAVKAVVNSAITHGLEPYLVFEGYKGLVENNLKKASKKDVKFIGAKGGTILQSARLPEFKEEKVRKVAVANLKKNKIDAVVGIGGDGTYMGLARLTEMGIKTVGLPGTIDNDISSTQYTIGFYTTLNTIVTAVDQIRDTMESHNRAGIVEVMGRHCGDLAIYAALATGAEVLSVPERKLTIEEIVKQVKQARKEGNRSIIVLITENMYNANELAKIIEAETKVETRATVLGYTQRGGVPQAMDRFIATRMGEFAVEKLLEGKTGIAVNVNNEEMTTKNILDVVKMKRPSREKLLKQYDNSK